jgi:hypothetical protein
MRQRATEYCHWEIMFVAWTVYASLSATSPTRSRIPLPFPSNGSRVHRFDPTTVLQWCRLFSEGNCCYSKRLLSVLENAYRRLWLFVTRLQGAITMGLHVRISLGGRITGSHTTNLGSVCYIVPFVLFIEENEERTGGQGKIRANWWSTWAEILEFHPIRPKNQLALLNQSPKFIFRYVTRTTPRPVFRLSHITWNPIYLQSALTNIPLIRVSFNA